MYRSIAILLNTDNYGSIEFNIIDNLNCGCNINRATQPWLCETAIKLSNTLQHLSSNNEEGWEIDDTRDIKYLLSETDHLQVAIDNFNKHLSGLS